MDLTKLSEAELDQESYRRQDKLTAARESCLEVQAERDRRWAHGVMARAGEDVARARQIIAGAGGIDGQEAVGTPGGN